MDEPLQLTSDERAAARAFLQRSEVRLSTLHRVGSALLSGAGLMVLLPTIARDSVNEVLHSLLVGGLDPTRALFVGSMVLAVGLPVTALWLLLKELTRFYFNAIHLHGEGSPFLPRYTLTGLRIPTDELGPRARHELQEIRESPGYLELAVPPNDRYRARVDEQYGLYRSEWPEAGLTDVERAELILEFAASRDRTLLGEVAKIEYGMARHVIRTQIVVLRYTKALIAIIVTAAMVYTAGGAVSDGGRAAPADLVWIGTALVVWAPCAMFAVGSPVRWLSRLLKRSDASIHLVRSDRELTHFEDITVRVAVTAWLLSTIGLVLVVIRDDVSTGGTVAGALALAASAVGVGVALVRWDGRRAPRRLVGRHR